MFDIIKKFRNNESGAVTVDWVVLTAAIVGIAIAVLTVISGGINNASTSINDGLDGAGTDIASLITNASAGFTPTTQAIYDNGYNYVASNTTDKALAYNIAYSNYQANPTADNLDFLAGSQTALEETGFVVGDPYVRVEDMPAT